MDRLSHLISSIDEGRTGAQSYIVEGRDQEPRNGLVERFVMALNCQNQDAGARPCGSCPSCKQIKAGTSMDIVHMQKSTAGGSYSAEKDVQPFIDRLSMGAYGRYTIGIIDDADSMNETVQNKILKTLEEPADSTIIILGSSDRDNLLSTVRSRCMMMRVSDYADDASEEDESIEAEDVPRDYFFRFRGYLGKKIKTTEDALKLLDVMEKGARDEMVSGHNIQENIRAIELMEIARKDMMRDMKYDRALKRLYLELS